MKLLAVWGTAVAVSFAWAKLTHIGPVVYTISQKHGWGVHSSDLVVAAIAAAGATVYTYKRLQAA